MTTVLFVSDNYANSHIKPAKDKGYNIVLLKSRPSEKDKKLFDYITKANIFDLRNVLNKVRTLNKKIRIDGVLTRHEAYTPVASAIRQDLGLPGPNITSGLILRDKIMMRRAFHKHNIPQPIFSVMNSGNDFKDLRVPFLFKPSCGAKSRYILKVEKKNEAAGKYKIVSDLMKQSHNPLFKKIKGLPDYKPQIIAEEIVKGKEITATSFVVNNKLYNIEFADIVTAQNGNIDAFYLISRTTPSAIPGKQKAKVKNIIEKAVKASGANDTPLHPELILSNGSPKMIEMAARVGGYRTNMTRLAFGIDLNEAAIEICLGNRPDLNKKFERACTAVEIWGKKSGKIKNFENLEEVQGMKGVKQFRIKSRIGDYYQVPPYGDKPIATFLTAASRPEKSLELASEVMEKFTVVI